MFGYVKIYKPELKIKEYEAYKGIYCTLCKEMQKEYGLLSRFLLSYDGAFYVMYKLGISSENINVSKSCCSFNPYKKCFKITTESDIYKIACAITVILAYFKLVDNINDSSFFKKILFYFIYPYFKHLVKKASKKYPDIFSIVEAGMNEQFSIEKTDEISIDKSAHPTADILSKLFSYGESCETFDSAGQFGYHLGRVVYFLDAFDDFEKDIKTESFNPFRNCNDVTETAIHTINMSAGSLVDIFKTQKFNNFSSIINNIICDGIDFQTERIIEKYRGDACE